ncbi:MAG: tetratricopeptide repeat protein [Candidatus Omnitrophica bacterium]|nr:tetratricopeptide repeat protein [Candidatus Omnitrophota bacterium]
MRKNILYHCFAVIFATALISFVLEASFSPGAYAASNEKELFVVAQRAFEDGFYDVSIRYVTQLLSEFPKTDKYVEARLLEGQCYFFKKQFLKAFTVFKEISEKDTYKDASLFWLGETYLKSGDYDKAREQYGKVIEAFPNSLYAPQAYYSLAWSYFEKADYAQAKKAFQQLIEKFPSNNLTEDSAFKLGECDYNAGQYEGAIFQFNKYLQGFSNSQRAFDATFNIAESYYYLEQYEQAVNFYKKSKELTKIPKNILSAVIGQGWGLIKLAKYEDALKAFTEAGDVAKANKLEEEDILLGKASLYAAEEKFSDSIASYTELVTRFPESPRAIESYLGRANTYYHQNDYAKAIADYKKIIELFGANAQYQKTVEKAQFGLAWTYLKSGAIDQSIDSFKGVLEKADSKIVKVSALTQIADAYQEAGQLDKAVTTYDRILKEFSDTPYTDYVQYRLGVVLLKTGKLDPAIMAFQALQSNFSKSKFILESNYYLGVAYFKKHDWATVVQIIEPFVKTVSVDNEFASEARYMLGLSYFNLKQFDKAGAVFNEIIKLFGNQEAVVLNARLGIAKIAYEQGNTKDALAAFSEIVFRSPKSDAALESLLWQGQHAMATGLYQRALEYYSQILNGFPDTDKKYLVHFELGRAYHAQGLLDKALEHYRLVDAGADPDLVTKAKLAIADIFSRELDPSKAVETYQNIITNSPEFKRDAFMKIAQIYRKDKQYKEELQAYENALQAPKGSGGITNAEIQFAIGDTYEITNDIDKAIEAYFKIPYLYEKERPWVVKAYFRIGKLYENKEDWDKAVTAYQKIVEYNVEESKVAQERILSIQDALKKK